MSKSKTTRRTKAAPVELREETAVRRAEAKLKLATLRLQAAAVKEFAALSTYGGADRGRRNKDWQAKNVSADMAIIPDAPILNPRARQMVRDTWIGEAGVSAFVRNVVGCGVIPIPQAKDGKGRLLTDLNRNAMLGFWEWAGDKQWCDAEGDQTFWQQESLAESERVTVGEAWWIWAYQPNRLPNGRIDLSRPVGLKIQMFEPEQLDDRTNSYTDPATNEVREVRGGIEVDSMGKAVAYHVFTRNPNDYAWTQQLKSVRVDAGRVLHYFRKKRVRQKRGVTDFAPVLTDMRDSARGKDANLTRMVAESCIGMTVERDVVAGPGGTLPGLKPLATGDSGTTPSGLPTIDFSFGMVADPGPGVKLVPFVPSTPGNGYPGFQALTLQGIAAGLGISVGQLVRKNDGSYSASRQDMLEDRKVFEPLQELMAHNLVFPVYRIFFALCVAEGRFDAPDFESNPMQYTAAEYVAPPPTWIDPKAEADALEKLVQLRVITREEIAHMRGTRLVDVLDKIAGEARDAGERGIAFAENNNQIPQAAAGKPRMSPDQFEQQANAYGVAVRAGAITPNKDDEKYFREQVGLPAANADVDNAWTEQPTRQPITIQQEQQPSLVGPEGAPPEPDPTGDLAKAIGKQADALAAIAKPAKTVHLSQADAPNYRLATADAPVNCAACRYFVTGRCEAYAFTAAADHVCDAFETPPAVGTGTGRRIVSGPGVPEGDRPMTDPRGGYVDRGERGVT